MHSLVCAATLEELGRSLVENMCTGNVWVVDNTYVSLNIGISYYCHSSVITHHPFGIFTCKLAIKESCNTRTLNSELITIKPEVITQRSLSGRISVFYATQGAL